MSVNIVTGYTGVAHVTSDDDRAKNSAIFGNSKFILDYGKKFAYEKLNNNQIRIKDGMAINQGTQMGIELNDFEDVVIENGTSGKTRIDLIVLRYEKNLDSGKESASLQVIKGTEVDSSPTIPNYLSGNILDGGDLIDDMPLYSVTISSLTISAVTAFSYSELTNLPEYYASANSLISELAEKIARYTAGSVTGVKGSSEEEYRSGDVDISLGNIVSTDINETGDRLPITSQGVGISPRIFLLPSNTEKGVEDIYAIGLYYNQLWLYYKASESDEYGEWVKVYPSLKGVISVYDGKRLVKEVTGPNVQSIINSASINDSIQYMCYINIVGPVLGGVISRTSTEIFNITPLIDGSLKSTAASSGAKLYEMIKMINVGSLRIVIVDGYLNIKLITTNENAPIYIGAIEIKTM